MSSIDLKMLKNEYTQLINIRNEFEGDWKDIINFLLPGHGTLYTQGTSVQARSRSTNRRRFVSKKVINTTGNEAQQVLTSGMQGGITSPGRPWFKLQFEDIMVQKIQQLNIWLSEVEKAVYKALAESNFYSVIHNFYTEYSGFGTGCLYMGEDSEAAPFRFELLTVGEYAIAVNPEGMVDKIFRTIYKSYRNMETMFGNSLPNELLNSAKSSPDELYPLIHCIYPDSFMGKEFHGAYFIMGHDKVLSEEGFYEFPYMVSRWDLVGSDVYGVGLGHKAVSDIKRLQEMEKSFLIASHKGIDPPVNAPARKKGQVRTLPGGINYYDNPNETVKPVYDVRFDYGGISASLERTEMRVKKIFFNDLFLTAARDPNLSPLKAAEVNVREEEKLLRLGPVVERMHTEVLNRLIERAVNILGRKGLLPPLDQSLLQGGQSYKINYVSTLSQAQKLYSMQPINNFLSLAGGVAQYKPEVIDKLNADALIDEYAEVSGVPQIILNSEATVKKIRSDRAKQQAEAQQKAEELATKELEIKAAATQGSATRDLASAGQSMSQMQQGTV